MRMFVWPVFMLFALGWASFAMALDEGSTVGPAPVAAPLRGDDAFMPPAAPAVVGPVEKVSTVEALEALPTEEQLRQEAVREAEARRPPPLQPRKVEQRVEVLTPGRMLILPREGPVEGGTVSGAMFNDDTETLQPVGTPPMLLEPLIGRMNTQAEALERVVADMEARMDAMDALAETSPTVVVSETVVVSTAEVVSAAAVAAESPKPVVKPLPKALVLPFLADMAGVGPSNLKKLNAWLADIGTERKVTLRITAHVLEPLADGLGEDPAKLAQRRASAVNALVTKAGVGGSKTIPLTVLRIKPGQTGGQRLVVSVTE